MNIISIEDRVTKMIDREQKVTMTKIQLIELWLHQGLDIMALLEDHDVNVKNVAKAVGISKSTAYNYFTIAKDERVKELFQPLDTDKRCQLEPFNQNQIMKLIALDNYDFEEALRKGKLPTNAKEDEDLPEVPLIEIIKHKRDLIVKIEDEIKELEAELSSTEEETIDAEIIPPQLEATKTTKQVYQMKDGDEIATFESMGEASAVTGITKSGISRVCNGERKKAGGYEWELR